MGGVSAALISAVKPAVAAVAPVTDRTLHLYHRQTGEFFKQTYFEDGFYRVDALDEVNWLLRDWRADKTKPIDPSLLDILYNIANKTDASKPFEILSGYRTPATNASLREHGVPTASHSYHMVGQAVDITLPGVSLRNMRKAALAIGQGGVGYYPRSGFIHVDTGDVRQWNGR
ncbi:hypothetical protein N825_04245 [Skermanella stibiiresistens SB22]|uniref:Murein endopeptidase K n=1 Tax=Skermanella stibiiresistens SB22 TaxID=1385369 RepID=W9H0N6_9PROT|nr:YcbK family protein [Skermanella stibiiresistens]EWY39735.1 hypothetical protein N825_04245 [Skermanella stibiiresistens SB22]